MSKLSLKLIAPVGILFILGFLGSFVYEFANFNFIKDIFHFIKPVLAVSIGYFYFRKISDFKLFVKSIVLVGFISAILHFLTLVFFSELNTVAGIREYARDNFLELFSLFFVAFYRKFRNESLFENQSTHKIIFYTLLISCVLYFSRTMVVIAVMLLLSFYGYTTLTKNSLKVLGIITLLSIGFYAYLFTIRLDRNAEGIENFFYKIKIAPAELFESKIDRNNHKDLWDHWRGYESKRAFILMSENPGSFLFGMGYGSLVNLKFKAPLGDGGDGLKYISELHNGYPYILYKTGIVGLFIYLFFLFRLYKTIYTDKTFQTILISSIGIYFLITTSTITGIYNNKDAIVFILGAMIFFKTNTEINQDQ